MVFCMCEIPEKAKLFPEASRTKIKSNSAVAHLPFISSFSRFSTSSSGTTVCCAISLISWKCSSVEEGSFCKTRPLSDWILKISDKSAARDALFEIKKVDDSRKSSIHSSCFNDWRWVETTGINRGFSSTCFNFHSNENPLWFWILSDPTVMGVIYCHGMFFYLNKDQHWKIRINLYIAQRSPWPLNCHQTFFRKCFHTWFLFFQKSKWYDLKRLYKANKSKFAIADKYRPLFCETDFPAVVSWFL